MINFGTTDLDSMMRDIIDIFNTDGVELVRLSGLFLRERRISNYQSLSPDELDMIIHKLKQSGAIKYRYVLYCPHCKDVSYQIVKRENPLSAKICDTCQQIYIPTKDVSLYEYEQEEGLNI